MNRFRRDYTVQFTVPAFLGDASQKGAWRTPPFKALLRQWWRVVVAMDHGYDYRALRETEGKLFGHAWLEHDGKQWARQSPLRIRLRVQQPGALDRWPPDKPAPVKFARAAVGNNAVWSDLYLGYGPIQNSKQTKSTCFDEGRTALNTNALATLTLLGSRQESPDFERQLGLTLQLIHWFGAIGGRARNGWGSIALGDADLHALAPDTALESFCRPLDACLRLDWPHAIGVDNGPLLWVTGPAPWPRVVKDLAELKGKMRGLFKLAKREFSPRHVLAYPVTESEVPEWRRDNPRFANQLRFKIMRDGAQYRGVLVHLPCGMPHHLLDFLGRDKGAWGERRQLEIWRRVHELLDKEDNLSRYGKVSP